MENNKQKNQAVLYMNYIYNILIFIIIKLSYKEKHNYIFY